MNLNIKLLILAPDKEHADGLSQKLMPILPFIGYQSASNIQEGLEAHLESPFDVCLITAGIPENDSAVLLKDMKKIYTEDKDKLCSFIKIMPLIPEQYDTSEDIAAGFKAVISEEFNDKDRENLKHAVESFMHFKQVQENISDVELTMEMILKEVDRVSSDRKRGRDTKFNTIAINFASDLVEFDSRVMDRYFECLSEESEKHLPSKALYVRIPKDVLSRNLPKLVDDRYTGASSRVWEMLVERYAITRKKKKKEDFENKA